jgi:hypothetical protein
MLYFNQKLQVHLKLLQNSWVMLGYMYRDLDWIFNSASCDDDLHQHRQRLRYKCCLVYLGGRWSLLNFGLWSFESVTNLWLESTRGLGCFLFIVRINHLPGKNDRFCYRRELLHSWGWLYFMEQVFFSIFVFKDQRFWAYFQ